MKNQYFYFRDDQHQINEPFDPSQPECLDIYGFAYVGRVLHEFEKRHPDQGLIIYVTVWTVHRLPHYGPNVISFIMQDEWSREPRYREKVGAVFHACGTRPMNLQANRYGTTLEHCMNILAYAKTLMKDGLKGRPRSWFNKHIAGKPLAPLHDFPLGYYANQPVTFIPFSERRYQLSFAGSVQHQTKRMQLPRPKEMSRARMIAALNDMCEHAPQYQVYIKKTEGFEDSIANTESYNEVMMQSQCCLIPRGANLETFRYYEAIRYGCIPVIESYPNLPYYHPDLMITLNDWSDLRSVMTTLLENPERMEQLHQTALSWWEEICSEPAIAKMVASKLGIETNTPPSIT